MNRLLNRLRMIFEIVRACPFVFALGPWLLLGIARGHPFDGKKTWLDAARTMGRAVGDQA